MKVEGKLYLTGSDNDLPAFLSASSEEKAQLVHFYVGDVEMSHVWTHVGSFEAEITLDKSKDLNERALKTIDAKLADLDQKYFMARQELESRRANLLCLEAPKE